MAMVPDLIFLFLKLCSTFCIITCFSAIHLSGMKADYVGEMSLWRRGLNLETRSWEMTL